MNSKKKRKIPKIKVVNSIYDEKGPTLQEVMEKQLIRFYEDEMLKNTSKSK